MASEYDKKYVSLALLEVFTTAEISGIQVFMSRYYHERNKEIPCNLTASLPGYSARNNVLLQKYLEIVNDLYVESKNDEIIGSFLIPNEGSSRAKRTNSKQPGRSKKERPGDSQSKPRQGLDIRMLFQRAVTRNREIKGQQNKDSSVVIID